MRIDSQRADFHRKPTTEVLQEQAHLTAHRNLSVHPIAHEIRSGQRFLQSGATEALQCLLKILLQLISATRSCLLMIGLLRIVS